MWSQSSNNRVVAGRGSSCSAKSLRHSLTATNNAEQYAESGDDHHADELNLIHDVESPLDRLHDLFVMCEPLAADVNFLPASSSMPTMVALDPREETGGRYDKSLDQRSFEAARNPMRGRVR